MHMYDIAWGQTMRIFLSLGMIAAAAFVATLAYAVICEINSRSVRPHMHIRMGSTQA